MAPGPRVQKRSDRLVSACDGPVPDTAEQPAHVPSPASACRLSEKLEDRAVRERTGAEPSRRAMIQRSRTGPSRRVHGYATGRRCPRECRIRGNPLRPIVPPRGTAPTRRWRASRERRATSRRRMRTVEEALLPRAAVARRQEQARRSRAAPKPGIPRPLVAGLCDGFVGSTRTQVGARRGGWSLSINPDGGDPPGRSVWGDRPPREVARLWSPTPGRSGRMADLIVLANERRKLR
jgi:hypothetical protein